MSCAAVIIIGDEILSGKFRDENSPWLIQRCRTLGIDLHRVCVIPDALDEIAEVVARWSERVDHVFTTGGVGPTHDDLTMAGIARAFSVPLVRNPALVQAIADKLGDRCNAAALRMADVPAGAELWWDGELFFPQVVVRNVCIFPGVPSLLRRKFDGIAHRLAGTPRRLRRMVTAEREIDIAARLRVIAEAFPQVMVGSYPQIDRRPWTVTITLDGRDEEALRCAEAALRAAIVPLEE